MIFFLIGNDNIKGDGTDNLEQIREKIEGNDYSREGTYDDKNFILLPWFLFYDGIESFTRAIKTVRFHHSQRDNNTFDDYSDIDENISLYANTSWESKYDEWKNPRSRELKKTFKIQELFQKRVKMHGQKIPRDIAYSSLIEVLRELSAKASSKVNEILSEILAIKLCDSQTLLDKQRLLIKNAMDKNVMDRIPRDKRVRNGQYLEYFVTKKWFPQGTQFLDLINDFLARKPLRPTINISLTGIGAMILNDLRNIMPTHDSPTLIKIDGNNSKMVNKIEAHKGFAFKSNADRRYTIFSEEKQHNTALFNYQLNVGNNPSGHIAGITAFWKQYWDLEERELKLIISASMHLFWYLYYDRTVSATIHSFAESFAHLFDETNDESKRKDIECEIKSRDMFEILFQHHPVSVLDKICDDYWEEYTTVCDNYQKDSRKEYTSDFGCRYTTQKSYWEIFRQTYMPQQLKDMKRDRNLIDWDTEYPR